MGIQINGQTDTISAFDNNFSLAGNVSIGGTLTYEDVTNVDAVGLSTFQAGIHLDDSITHLGDTNTKIRFPAADTITAETGGSERLRIDSSGNVGIDQATPSSFGKFVVNGTGNIISLTSSSGAGSLSFFEGGTGRFYIKTLNGSDGLSFVDGDGSSERLRITSDGKIGVNESNPGCLSGGIHLVHSDAEGTPTFTGGETAIFQRNFNSAQSSEISIVSGTASKSTINFGDKDDVNIGMIQYENNNNAFVFTTNTSERLRITSGGLLGIGTDNPGHLLDLYNSDGLDCLRLNVNGSAGGSSKQNAIRFSVDGDIKAHMGLAVDAGRLISGSIANDFCLKGLGSNNILFATNSTERLRITSGGLLGIGTDNPGAKLHVQGTNAEIWLRDSDSKTLALQTSSTTQYIKAIDIGTGGLPLEFYASQYHFGTGNVGINQSNPSTKLEVGGGSILVDAYNTSGNHGIFFRRGFNPNSYSYNLSILAYDHNSNGSTKDGLSINAYDGISFCTGSNTRAEKLRITSGGQMILGTASNLGSVPPKFTIVNNTNSSTFSECQLLRLNGPSGVGERGGIGFHYAQSSDYGEKPASFIGNETVSVAGGQKADLIFATRDTTADNEPTERLRITSDGHLVYDTNKGGIYNFDKACSANASTNIFKIDNNHGAHCFTIYMTGSNNGNSVSKIYHVACKYGASPTINSAADTGAYGGNNFTLTGSDSGSSHTFAISVTGAAATISCTVVLGSMNTSAAVTVL